MKDLKSELDLIKRRIERQENDYIQTMKLNSMLKSQVHELKSQDGRMSKQVRDKSPDIHFPADKASLDLQEQNFKLEKEKLSFKS